MSKHNTNTCLNFLVRPQNPDTRILTTTCSVAKQKTGMRNSKRPHITEGGKLYGFYCVVATTPQLQTLGDLKMFLFPLVLSSRQGLIPSNCRVSERGCTLLGSQTLCKPAGNENKMPRFWKGGLCGAIEPGDVKRLDS